MVSLLVLIYFRSSYGIDWLHLFALWARVFLCKGFLTLAKDINQQKTEMLEEKNTINPTVQYHPCPSRYPLANVGYDQDGRLTIQLLR